MRYRPFGRSGVAVSAVTLQLGPHNLARGPEATRNLIYAALEAGVNTFHLTCPDVVLAEVVGQALSAIDRHLVFVSLAIGRQPGRHGEIRDFSPQALTRSIDQCLTLSGLGWIDLVLLDAPGIDELPQAALTAIKAERDAGRVKLMGVCGDHDAMDAYISTNAFDVIATSFHVNAPWTTKARMRAAQERDMAVIAHGYFPAELDRPEAATRPIPPRRGGLFGIGAKPAEADPQTGAFDFLHQTHGWAAEEICLAFALTDPTISTVLIQADNVDQLTSLSAVPERDLPPGLGAMVEMARVRAAA